MFELYTEQARRALFFARYEAFQLGSAFVETEHVLLGLLREEQSAIARVLATSRLSIEEVRREVEARTARRAVASESADVPFSDETRKVLEYSAQEADRLLHDHVGTEHLLLGLLREDRGVAAIILNEHGLRLAAVRDRIVAMLGSAPIARMPFPFARRAAGGARALHVQPSRRERGEGPLVVSAPHRVSADGFTLRELVAWAYRADVRHVELPADLDDRERYDARLDLPAPQSWPAIDRLIQDGLESHFGVTVTRETRRIDAFVLTAREGPSPGLRRADQGSGGGETTTYAAFSTVAFDAFAGEPPPGMSAWHDRLHSFGPILLTGTTMKEFAESLEEFVGRPVIDETGLAGTYDIEVRGEMEGLDEVRQALLEQLSLDLARTQREASLLAVRRTSRTDPTAGR